MKITFATLAMAGALITSVPAHAALVDTAYNFEASFTSGPNSKINGTINLLVDNVDYTKPVTFKSFTSSALTGYAVNLGGSGRSVWIGNCWPGICSVTNGANEFFLTFRIEALNNASSANFAYAKEGVSGIFSPTSVTISRVSAAAVPEPATWAMMVLGFGVVGYAMRRKTVLRFV